MRSALGNQQRPKKGYKRYGNSKSNHMSKGNKETGNDGIPAEISNRNIDIWINPIKLLIQNVTTGEMPEKWKQGVITLI